MKNIIERNTIQDPHLKNWRRNVTENIVKLIKKSSKNTIRNMEKSIIQDRKLKKDKMNTIESVTDKINTRNNMLFKNMFDQLNRNFLS